MNLLTLPCFLEECLFLVENFHNFITNNNGFLYKEYYNAYFQQIKDFLFYGSYNLISEENNSDKKHENEILFLNKQISHYKTEAEESKNKLLQEKNAFENALKLEKNLKNQIILYFQRKISKIIEIFDEDNNDKFSKIHKKLVKLNSSTPWKSNEQILLSETSTPYSNYSGIPTSLNQSFQESLNNAEIYDSNLEENNTSNIKYLKEVVVNKKNMIVKIENDLSSKNHMALKDQENVLMNIHLLKESIKDKKLRNNAFIKNANINEILRNTNEPISDLVNDNKAIYFDQVLDVKLKDNLNISKESKKINDKTENQGSNLIIASFLKDIKNIDEKINANQSLLSLFENNQDSNLLKNQEKLFKESHQSKNHENIKKSNKTEKLFVSSTSQKNKQKNEFNETKKNEENPLKNYNPCCVLNQSTMNKISNDFAGDIKLFKKCSENKNLNRESDIKYNKIKLVLNKVNFSEKKIQKP